MTRRKTIWLTIVIVLVAGVVFVVVGMRNTIREAYASEWVAGHVIRYMEANCGKWPESWSDLKPIHEQVVSENRDRSPWKFEMLQRHVIVDWSADPAKLVAMPTSSDSPPFQVVRGRHGAYWSGMEPNRLIHEWLLTNLDSATAGRGSNESQQTLIEQAEDANAGNAPE